jgi:hypothetical protein
MISIKSLEKTNCFLIELSDMVNHIGKVEVLKACYRQQLMVAHTLCMAYMMMQEHILVLETFPLVLEPMIGCPTCIGSGRSRCLPKATRADDSCISIISTRAMHVAASSSNRHPISGHTIACITLVNTTTVIH